MTTAASPQQRPRRASRWSWPLFVAAVLMLAWLVSLGLGLGISQAAPRPAVDAGAG